MTMPITAALTATVASILCWTIALRTRRSAPVPPTPALAFRNVRVLRHDEVEEAARRAQERERVIARAAELRAAHFDELLHARAGEAEAV